MQARNPSAKGVSVTRKVRCGSSSAASLSGQSHQTDDKYTGACPPLSTAARLRAAPKLGIGKSDLHPVHPRSRAERKQQTSCIKDATLPRQPAAAFLDTLSYVLIALVRNSQTDLSMRGLSIMLAVATRLDPQTVRGIAEQLQVSKPSVTRTVDRLQDLGLMKRIADPADRRSVLLVLTAAGRAYVRKIERARNGRVRQHGGNSGVAEAAN